jgi:hypothetical protein
MMSWEEVYSVGLARLESVGAEIAAATTQANAATAEVRMQTILGVLHQAEVSMLRIATRKLGSGLPGLLFGYGRRGIAGKFEPIPPEHWEAGDVDWDKWRLTVDGEPTWIGVRVLDFYDLDAEQIRNVEDDFKPRKKQGLGGRPTEHDWDGARSFADEYVTKNGLPETRKRLIEVIGDWFVKNDGGVAPADRQIRENVTAKFYATAKGRN